MLLQVKLNYFPVWLTETSTAVRRAQAGGAEAQAFCSLDDIPAELKARLSTAWAPWAGAVPASSGGGLAADGSSALEQDCAVSSAGFLCAEALEPFPAHLDHPHWPHGLHMTKHWCIQDIHPPLLWAASLQYKPVWQMYSSTPFWQLLCQLLLLLFRARPLLVELLPGLYPSFWFISFVFRGKSGCSTQEQWYNYVRALFPFQRGQDENLQGYLFVFWQCLANAETLLDIKQSCLGSALKK